MIIWTCDRDGCTSTIKTTKGARLIIVYTLEAHGNRYGFCSKECLVSFVLHDGTLS